MNHVTVGSLACPGVDADAWRKQNRVPLFPGKVNRWLFAASVEPGANDADLMADLHELFWTWFEGSSTTVSDAVNRPTIWIYASTEFEAGNADNVRIVKASPEPTRLANPARRREDLPGPLPALKGGKQVVYVELTFTYRGQLTDLPWPTYTHAAWTATGKVCPNAAQWMLIDAGAPADGAPPPRTMTERLTTGTAATLKEIASGITEGLGFTGVLSIGAGVALTIYLLNKFK